MFFLYIGLEFFGLFTVGYEESEPLVVNKVWLRWIYELSVHSNDTALDLIQKYG